MEKKENMFVWNSLRISFWIMVVSWVIMGGLMFLSAGFGFSLIFIIPLTFLTILSPPFNFILSILHLRKYEKKSFAIISLIVSSILGLFLFLFFTGFWTTTVESFP